MDTRTKITSFAQIPKTGRSQRVVVGYFDPLHDAHVNRLHELNSSADTLIVAVDDPPDPLLSLRARQELVAGLETVHYVVAASELGERAPDGTLDEREADLARRQKLIQHVISRYTGAAA